MNDITTDHAVYVREMQTWLCAVGEEPPAVDGIYGPETAACVRAFQAAHGLPETGETDRITWEALRDACDLCTAENSPPRPVSLFKHTLRIGDRGDCVVMICLMINALSRRFKGISPVTVQSGYCHDLSAAISSLQHCFGLEPTGNTDKITWDRLVLLYDEPEEAW